MEDASRSKVSRMSGRRLERTARQAIVVLGMHRSGTSAVGGVLAKLGVEPPRSLMHGDEGNPRGYWESSSITQFNDDVLASAGTAWNDWQQLNPGWIRSVIGKQYMERLALLLEEEFGQARLFFIKDPRMCRLLSVWLPVLAGMGIEAKFVIPFRHPLEVAKSLAERGDRFAPRYTLLRGQAQLVWLRHVLDAELGSRGGDRAFLPYGDFLTDWRRETKRIGEELGIVWSRMSAIVEEEIDGFLTAELRHHDHAHDGLSDGSAVGMQAMDVYRVLCELTAGETGKACGRLDDIRKGLNAASEVYAPVVQEVHAEVGRRLSTFAERLSECEAKVEEFDAKNRLLKQEAVANYELAMRHKATLEDVRAQLHGREATFAAQEARYQSGQDELGRIRRESEAASRAAEAAKAELASSVASFQDRIEGLQRSHAESSQRFKQEASELGARLHGQIRELREEKRVVEEAAQERASEIVSLTRRVIELEDMLAARDAVIGTLKSDMGKCNARQIEQAKTIEVQQRNLKEQDARVQTLFSELEAHSQIIARYRQMLSDIHSSGRLTLPSVLRRKAGDAIRVCTPERTEKSDEALVRKSGLFDRNWYLARYPDVHERSMDPVRHYLHFGAKEGRDPGPAFSTSGYQSRHQDVSIAGINPLVHYLVYGRNEGRGIAVIESEKRKDGLKNADHD